MKHQLFPRKYGILLCASLLSLGAVGEETSPPSQDPAPPAVENLLQQIDKVSQEPEIPLKEALAIAEAHAKEDNIDVSGHYLDSIRLQRNEKSGTRTWLVTWLPKQQSIGGEIWISVPTDRKMKPTVEFGR
jgi:hypothetical protein